MTTIAIKLPTRESRIAAMRMQLALNNEASFEVVHSHSQDDDLVGCDIAEFQECDESLNGDESGYCTGDDREEMEERLDSLLDQDGDEWEVWINDSMLQAQHWARGHESAKSSAATIRNTSDFLLTSESNGLAYTLSAIAIRCCAICSTLTTREHKAMAQIPEALLEKNLQRAMAAETTLHDYQENKQGYDNPVDEDTCRDLITDILHLLYCDEKTAGCLNPEQIRAHLDMAFENFMHEAVNPDDITLAELESEAANG